MQNGGNMATLNIKEFPENLYQMLAERARLDRRSITQEVIHLLCIALEEAGKPSILELRGLGKKKWNGIDASKHIKEERGSWE